jgi:hypothetical protein
MVKLSKIMLVCAVLFGASLSALADRGVGKKSNSKVTLNISTPTTLRNSVSLNFKSGLAYTGSLYNKKVINGNMVNSTLVTYQKGNTVYIIPYKQRMIVPELKQGYTGMKLIIKSH